MTTKLMTFFGNSFVAAIAVLAAIFAALVRFVPLDTLITLLNGAFVGTMIGVTIAYGGMFYDAFWNRKRHGKLMATDVRLFAVFYLGAWFAYTLTVYGSVSVRSTDASFVSMYSTALGRYVAIICAIGGVVAPTWDETLFYGRDRKSVFAAVFVGLLAATVVVIIQETQAFAELLP